MQNTACFWGGEAGAEKHPQDQASGNEVNPQHHQPRSTRSCKAAPWDKEVLATLLTAQLKTPCTEQKAQPGPAGSKPLQMTGPLQNSPGHSTELQWWGSLCRDSPEPLPAEVPHSSPIPRRLRAWGVFRDQHNRPEKRAAVCLGLASFSQMCCSRGKGAAEPASWRKRASPAHSQACHLPPALGCQKGMPASPRGCAESTRGSPGLSRRRQGTRAALKDTDGSQGRWCRAPSLLPCRA